jgi:hypothetical protein
MRREPAQRGVVGEILGKSESSFFEEYLQKTVKIVVFYEPIPRLPLPAEERTREPTHARERKAGFPS